MNEFKRDFFKITNSRNTRHLAFIRTLPCTKCCARPCEAAHLRIGTDGGMGLKSSDRYTVPLCQPCHREQHRVGERTFWLYRNLDVRDLADFLYEHTGQAGACRIVLWGFWQ